jgi:tetratricopeptide (TPR) repeat protein
MGLATGTKLGSYEIQSQLGAGGMGEVYRARDTQLGREVAIKVLPNISPERMRRFEQEARAASALNHPNILTIHAVGEHDGMPFIVSELVAGETLRQRLERGPLSLCDALNLTIQVGEALEAAHSAGLVHRDIKPANIMIRPDGYAKVLDFGLVKLLESPSGTDLDATREKNSITATGTVVGTLNYMSPEQVRGTGEDARSDIFSLGTVLYEMVAGHRPFEGNTSADQIAALLEGDLVQVSTSATGIPPEFDRIVAKMLRKDREERYHRVSELMHDLRSLRQELDLLLKLPSLPRRIREEPRTRRVAFLTAIPLLALTLILGWFAVRWWRPAPHRVPPEAERWYQVGITALREGAYHQASGALEKAVQIDQSFVLARARLAEAWAELDQSDKAKDALLEVARLVPDRSSLPALEQTHIQAVSSVVVRDFPAAVTAYRKALSLGSDTEKPQINVDLGRTLEKNGDSEDALKCYLEAGMLDPQYAVPLLLAGVLYGRARDYDKALSVFATAENIYRLQGNVEGRAEVLYQRGTMFLRQTRLTEAKADFEAVRELARATGNNSQQVRAVLQLSDVLFDQGAVGPAEEAALEAIRLATDLGFEDLASRAHIKLGDRKFQQGDLQTAEVHYRRALDQARRSKARYNEALSLFMLGSVNISRKNLDAGLGFVKQALAYYRPGGYRQEVLLGLTLVARANRIQGNYEAALTALEEQLPLAEKSGSGAERIYLHYDYGRLLEQLGRYPAALEQFDKGSSICRSLKVKSEMGSGEASQGRILGKMGRRAESRAHFEKVALLAGKDHALTWDLLISQAEVALLNERFEEASRLAQKAMDFSGDQKDALIQVKRIMGLAILRSGAPRKGRLICEQAFALARDTSDAALLAEAEVALAEALLATGDAGGAQAKALDLALKFSQSKQKELEWHAAVLAMRAAGQVGNLTAARDAAIRARGLLNEKESQWGPQDFNSYASRPDVARARRELDRYVAQKH